MTNRMMLLVLVAAAFSGGRIRPEWPSGPRADVASLKSMPLSIDASTRPSRLWALAKATTSSKNFNVAQAPVGLFG